MTMQFVRCLFVGQFTIFCYQFILVYSTPMVGPSVESVLDEEFPYLVSIKKTGGEADLTYGHICSGSLISRKAVLTCEHCVEDEFPHTIHVSVGSQDLRHGEKYEILYWTTYVEWAMRKNVPLEFDENDIAIIRLAKRIPSEIKTANLSPLSIFHLYGLQVTMVGWGESETGSLTPLLKKANVQVVPNHECEERMNEVGVPGFPAPHMVLCTHAQPPALLHKGDSGGPLVYRDTIVGVNSGTIPFPEVPNRPQKFNVHFNVYYYLEFIYNAM